ncbi:MAG: hypothetical protein SPJ13_06875, partial [Bacteroidales bacterium]|nr:hypothetical protein [Bacteroidales bacterium]
MAKNKRKPAASAMILFMAALMVAACSEKDANHVAGVNNVYVSVTGTESSAAKVSVLETQNIKALTLVFFDAQNNKVFDSTQLKSNFMGVDLANFGRFSCLLPSGTYS